MDDRVSGQNESKRRDPAWYVMGALVALGIGLIVFDRHKAPVAVAAPLVGEAHAAEVAPVETSERVEVEFGPPAPVPSSSTAPSMSAMAKVAEYVPAPAKGVAPEEAPAATFYVEEPLRYTSASDGEKWRATTTKKISTCVESVGTGDCALHSMQLHCTLDRHGVLHCSRIDAFDKTGASCAAPRALEECIGRAASGLIAHPQFQVADVQLAEMKYWIRRAQ